MTPPILGYSLLCGALASMHQMLLTKGLAKERVGPAAAMQSTFVLASFLLQLIVTPDDHLAPLSLCGALVIVASVVLILATKRAGGGGGSTMLRAGQGGSDDPKWAGSSGSQGGGGCGTVELEGGRDGSMSKV